MNPHPLAHELIRQHAQRTPDAIALEAGTTRLTYAQLDLAATIFAQQLLATGLQPEAIVAVDAHRTPETLVAMLGIWKAGGAYLPLDPALPPARRDAILADAQPHCTITTRIDGKGSGQTLAPPRLQPAPTDHDASKLPTVRASNLAYVLYTSGSTGTPKGVLVEHEGLAHRAQIQRNQFAVQPNERCTQYSNLAWDASLFEIFLPWSAGATLILIPDDLRRSGTGLARYLANTQANIAFFPPSVLATLPETPLPALRAMMVGGDAFPESLVARWGNGRRFVNLYGPTETTIWTSTDDCQPGTPACLGRPIDGVQMISIDDEGRVLPPGQAGELCISGIGLARGYLGMPEATAARFQDHPELPGTRLYRTGDRGLIRPDGCVEMHGRIDGQVKIRGMRVELGDIEAALGNVPRVRACAVATHEDTRDSKQLIAYVHLDETTEGPASTMAPEQARSLREALHTELPPALVPSHFIELAPLPRTPNGKLDRKALPDPRSLVQVEPVLVEGPRNPTERLLVQLWTQELAKTPGIHDNVFELGAHSLLAARVQEALEQELGRPLDILLLFEHPTIAGLSKQLQELQQGAQPTAHAATPSRQAGTDRGAARRAAHTQRRRPTRTPEDTP